MAVARHRMLTGCCSAGRVYATHPRFFVHARARGDAFHERPNGTPSPIGDACHARAQKEKTNEAHGASPLSSTSCAGEFAPYLQYCRSQYRASAIETRGGTIRQGFGRGNQGKVAQPLLPHHCVPSGGPAMAPFQPSARGRLRRRGPGDASERGKTQRADQHHEEKKYSKISPPPSGLPVRARLHREAGGLGAGAHRIHAAGQPGGQRRGCPEAWPQRTPGWERRAGRRGPGARPPPARASTERYRPRRPGAGGNRPLRPISPNARPSGLRSTAK